MGNIGKAWVIQTWREHRLCWIDEHPQHVLMCVCVAKVLANRSLARYFLTVIETDNNGSRSITSLPLLLVLVLCMSRSSLLSLIISAVTLQHNALKD